jgi:hypothetical protein
MSRPFAIAGVQMTPVPWDAGASLDKMSAILFWKQLRDFRGEFPLSTASPRVKSTATPTKENTGGCNDARCFHFQPDQHRTYFCKVRM